MVGVEVRRCPKGSSAPRGSFRLYYITASSRPIGVGREFVNMFML